jgi:general stress protein YciG
MDPAKRREIASKGGKAAHAQGSAHEFTPDEARVAGRKGGEAAHARGTAHQFTPEEAREAGRKGGQARSARSAARTTPESTTNQNTSMPPAPAAPETLSLAYSSTMPHSNVP